MSFLNLTSWKTFPRKILDQKKSSHCLNKYNDWLDQPLTIPVCQRLVGLVFNNTLFHRHRRSSSREKPKEKFKATREKLAWCLYDVAWQRLQKKHNLLVIGKKLHCCLIHHRPHFDVLPIICGVWGSRINSCPNKSHHKLLICYTTKSPLCGFEVKNKLYALNSKV